MIMTEKYLDLLSELWKCHAERGRSFEIEIGHKTFFINGTFRNVILHFQEKSGCTVIINGVLFGESRDVPKKIRLSVSHENNNRLQNNNRLHALIDECDKWLSIRRNGTLSPSKFVGRMGISQYHITHDGVCIFITQEPDYFGRREKMLQEYLEVLSQKTGMQCEFVFDDNWLYDEDDGEIMHDEAAIALIRKGYGYPKDLILNCNDFFGPGSDAEVISGSEIVSAFKAMVINGFEGVMSYVKKKRGGGDK